jgi:hypothetical protein
MTMSEKKRARILAASLEAIDAGDDEKKDHLLREYPQMAEEINRLIEQAEILKNLPRIEMDAITLQTRKMQLVFKLPAREHVVTKTKPFRLNQQKAEWRFSMSWIVIVATVVSLLTGAGAVYASGDALPGEALYPVKMLVEDAQLALSPDLIDTELRMQFADHRISELVELLKEGRMDDAESALSGYQNQVALLATLMGKIEAASPEEAVQLRTELQTKLQEQAIRMQTIMDGQGEMVRETVQTMLQTNTEMRARLQINVAPAVPGDPAGEADTEIPQEQPQGGGANGQGDGQQPGQVQSGRNASNIVLTGETLDGSQLRLMFSGEAIEGQSYYLEIGGQRQDCTMDNGMIICTMNQIMQQGTASLYEKNTNWLLFQYAFDFSRQMQQGKPESDLEDQGMNGGDQGQNGKK